ncbi:MAG: hypothetical protein M3R00_02570, partial [Pseudomonadota bacterium]|nr:hypothetical protein [Pseudomonadota bacterium]
ITYGAKSLHFEFGDAEIGEKATFSANGAISGTVERDLTIKGECKLNHNNGEGQGKITIKGKLTVEGENADVKFAGIETKANEALLLRELTIAENSTLDAKHT